MIATSTFQGLSTSVGPQHAARGTTREPYRSINNSRDRVIPATRTTRPAHPLPYHNEVTNKTPPFPNFSLHLGQLRAAESAVIDLYELKKTTDTTLLDPMISNKHEATNTKPEKKKNQCKRRARAMMMMMMMMLCSMQTCDPFTK